MIRIEIVRTPLAFDRPMGLSALDRGAVVEFQGIVRGIEDGEPIGAIDYECHEEMARAQLEKIAWEVAAAQELSDITILHRIGPVAAGETSLYIRTVATHRREAFDAAMTTIERIKQDVPIWKHPLRRA